jgi:voltage-gated potassium channel
MRIVQRVARGRQLAYAAGLTVLASLLAAVGVLFFDRGVEGATIRSFGDALWWSSAMVTTINNEKYAVSPEARVIAILLRVFAVSIFGLVTAAVASYFVGRDAEVRGGVGGGLVGLEQGLSDLHREHALLRADLAAMRGAVERIAAAADPAEPAPAAAPIDGASTAVDVTGSTPDRVVGGRAARDR